MHLALSSLESRYATSDRIALDYFNVGVCVSTAKNRVM